MLFGIGGASEKEFHVYALRRKDLTAHINEQLGKDGIVLLFAGFESERHTFIQESSFWYFTGINEPSLALTMDLDGSATLYNPNCAIDRSQWVHSPLQLTPENAKKIGFKAIAALGDACPGYSFSPFLPENMYHNLVESVAKAVQQKKKIYTLFPKNPHAYIEQRIMIQHIGSFVPGLIDSIIDISDIVADMRCHKDREEIELIHEAVQVTQMAQEAAARAIAPGILEAEVQAGAQYVMTAANGVPAFPSIVGSGKNSTTLHYTTNNGVLKKDKVVVVDIGVQLNHYCADLTRTYPVSGKFSKRQREIYTMVLEAQALVAEKAKPGMWLKNKDRPEQSLHHIAVSYFKSKGYDQYFPHGIGHYLGLDVHDVGDYSKPLQEGDVITIEPGLYLPEEGIGIRIEDNYWIVKGGAICLSEDLPRSPGEVEAFVQEGFENREEISEEEMDFEEEQ